MLPAGHSVSASLTASWQAGLSSSLARLQREFGELDSGQPATMDIGNTATPQHSVTALLSTLILPVRQ